MARVPIFRANSSKNDLKNQEIEMEWMNEWTSERMNDGNSDEWLFTF